MSSALGLRAQSGRVTTEARAGGFVGTGGACEITGGAVVSTRFSTGGIGSGGGGVTSGGGATGGRGWTTARGGGGGGGGGSSTTVASSEYSWNTASNFCFARYAKSSACRPTTTTREMPSGPNPFLRRGPSEVSGS